MQFEEAQQRAQELKEAEHELAVKQKSEAAKAIQECEAAVEDILRL